MDKDTLGPIALVAVVLVVGAMFYVQQTRTTYPIPQGPAAQTAPGGTSGTTGGMGSTGTGATQSGPPTTVPKGTSLKEYVGKYYSYVKAEKYDKAYEMQAASAKTEGGEASFTQTRQGMPLKSFTITSAKQSSKTATVEVKQVLGGQGAGAPWITQWNFSKKNGAWVVEGTQSQMAQ